ncbi:MAG TPA: hypothetical protein ACFYD3_06945 [Candidatus Hypogeohydataceae bacterium YC41]
MERGNLNLKVGRGELAAMLVLTWLCLPGLGQLIFLWNDKKRKVYACIALAVSGTFGSSFLVWGESAAIFFIWFFFGMAIWMTIDAINAYKIYKQD